MPYVMAARPSVASGTSHKTIEVSSINRPCKTNSGAEHMDLQHEAGRQGPPSCVLALFHPFFIFVLGKKTRRQEASTKIIRSSHDRTPDALESLGRPSCLSAFSGRQVHGAFLSPALSSGSALQSSRAPTLK